MTLIIENAGERAAIEELWEKYSSTPSSTEFMTLAEQLRRRGCQGQAVEICARAKAAYPGYVSCRVLLGRCLMEMGRRDEALNELEQVLELDRENAFSLRAMAELRMAQGNLSEAANYYRALVRINPADLDMQQKLAQVVRALEPFDGDACPPAHEKAAGRRSGKRESEQEQEQEQEQENKQEQTQRQEQIQKPVQEQEYEQEVGVRPLLLGTEEAVEMALEGLQTSEAKMPAWHLEDRVTTAQAPPRPVLYGGWVSAGAAAAITERAPVGLQSAGETRTTPAPDSGAERASADTATQRRTPAQFFNYSNRRSDFALFAQWVERERGGARN